MVKTLLINPPQTFYKKSVSCVEQLPLGLLYIAGVLKKEGVEVEVLDALREGDNLSQEGDSIHYGLSWSDIAKKIRICRPDIVGISNPYSSQVMNAVMVANIAKRIDPNIATIMGGAHPTVAAFDLMNKETTIDICVRGEGEYVIKDLIKDYFIKKEKNIEDIPGLVYRNKGMILDTAEARIIEQLDNLPFPAYEILDVERYLNKDYRLRPCFPQTLRVIEMITSRGCPYNCIFCSVKCVMGNRFRAHSPEYVLNHIRYVTDKYRIEHIRFNDDNLSLNRHRFDAILSGIIERKLKFSWDCPNGIRGDTLDEPLLEKMKQAGCEHIFIAAESGNQDVVNKIIGKNFNLSYIEGVLKLCNNIGIQAGTYFVLGLPGETLNNIRQTKKLALKFLLKYNAIPEFFIATPLPGTELLKICEENGYLSEGIDAKNLSIITQGKAIIHTDEFTPDEVDAIYKAANRDCSIIRKIRLLFTDPFLFFKKVFHRLFLGMSPGHL